MRKRKRVTRMANQVSTVGNCQFNSHNNLTPIGCIVKNLYKKRKTIKELRLQIN